LPRIAEPVRSLLSDRERFVRVADGLAVALAASLPWSTSVTGILAALLLVALLPTIDLQRLRAVLITPAGGLPVLLVALGAIGMLWADVAWRSRFGGLSPFLKLLFIPLLLHHFSYSERGRHVLNGFVISCVALLIVSWTSMAWHSMPWPVTIKMHGIPVKDYVSQSAVFTTSAFALMLFADVVWRDGQRLLALALLILALIFIANILYIATSRTSLVAIPVLMLVLGYRLFGWKGGVGLVMACLVLAAAAWPSSTFMRARVTSFFTEVQNYGRPDEDSSAGLRLEWWGKSIGFIKAAPVIGHGTGTVSEQFRRAVVQNKLEASSNPHNQILAVGIQLGFVGIAALLAMWAAHLALFRPGGIAATIGLLVAVQNVVSSLFNSHLFDFTQGWLYVIGVGIAGGMMLRKLAAPYPTFAAVASPASPSR
jgi:O-antigen ligase